MKKLDEVDLHLTSDCNLKCAFCAIGAGKESVLYMSISGIREIAQQLSDLVVNHIHLTGGEPTLHRDLLEIVGVFSKIGAHVRLQTNAYSITPDLLKELKISGLEDLMISVDGDKESGRGLKMLTVN